MVHRPVKRVTIMATVMGVVFLFLTVTGCAALQRPGPEGKPDAPPGVRQVLPTDPREASQLADRLAKTASETPGVNRATVVLAGTTAYVGVDLKAEMEKEQTNAVKKEVANRVKESEPRIERVMVTTDIDSFKRLDKIAEGIRNGQPVSAFTDELAEINRRFTPITR